jgi:Na+/proline symporter
MLGDIFIYSQKLINMFTGPLFGVFVLAMFTKRATAPATLIAGFIGFVMGSLLVFGKIMQVDSLTVGVLWPATISFTITVVLGYLLSYVLGKNTEESHNYTRASVMKADFERYDEKKSENDDLNEKIEDGESNPQ